MHMYTKSTFGYLDVFCKVPRMSR